MDFITVLQLVSAVILIALILLQSKSAGIAGIFGGSGAVFTAKRGFEKTLFRLTIVVAIIFIALALFNVIS